MKIFSVIYHANVGDNDDATTEVFPTRQEALNYMSDEAEILTHDYDGWCVMHDTEEKFVIATHDYAYFIELKLTEHEIKD